MLLESVIGVCQHGDQSNAMKVKEAIGITLVINPRLTKINWEQLLRRASIVSSVIAKGLVGQGRSPQLVNLHMLSFY